MPRSPLLVRKAVSFQKPYRLMWSLRAALSFHGLMTLSRDRKSTRLNSSHGYISYAVFCLKKKKNEYLVVHDHERAEDHVVGGGIDVTGEVPMVHGDQSGCTHVQAGAVVVDLLAGTCVGSC